MPRHVQVSPEEDLSAWGEAAPSPAASRPAAAPRPAAPRATPAAARAAAPAPVAAPSPVAPPAPAVEPLATDDDTDAATPVRSGPVAAYEPGEVATTGAGPNAILAAILSFLFPGVGQMMCGQGLKGAVLFAGFVFTCGGFGILSLVAAADAFLVAKRANRGEPVGPWQFF